MESRHPLQAALGISLLRKPEPQGSRPPPPLSAPPVVLPPCRASRGVGGLTEEASVAEAQASDVRLPRAGTGVCLQGQPTKACPLGSAPTAVGSRPGPAGQALPRAHPSVEAEVSSTWRLELELLLGKLECQVTLLSTEHGALRGVPVPLCPVTVGSVVGHGGHGRAQVSSPHVIVRSQQPSELPGDTHLPPEDAQLRRCTGTRALSSLAPSPLPGFSSRESGSFPCSHKPCTAPDPANLAQAWDGKKGAWCLVAPGQ